MESLVIQAKATRSQFFKDPFETLTFVHFADVHYEKENWDVHFMPGEFSMTYYKDFPKANVRLVVYDC